MKPPEDETRLNPEEERELEAVDRALAGEPVDPEHAALAELTRELRAERPVAHPEFTSELDSRAASGFPRRSGRAGGGLRGLLDRLVPPRRIAAPAAAVAVAIAALAIAISQTSVLDLGGTEVGREQAAPGGDTEVLRAALRPSGLGPAEGGPLLSVDPLLPGSGTDPAASLTLSTAPGTIPRVASEVARVVDRYRGNVISAVAVVDGEEEPTLGRIELGVAPARLPSALADLSQVARLESRQEGSADTAIPLTLMRERARDLEAELRELERERAGADTREEARALDERIGAALLELDGANSLLLSFRHEPVALVGVTIETSE